MNILVTGGAGYIGSHAAKALLKAGHTVSVLDNLHRGHRQAVDERATFFQMDLRQTDAVAKMLKQQAIDCVMHFAALAFVGESVEQPLLYYDNNTAGTTSLLQAMHQSQVKRLVFSSTCATYGQPDAMPITEDAVQSPINPYGWSKLFVERILKDHVHANNDFAYAALRYFNVAGCSSDGSIGEDHDPETHIIPILLFAAMGKRESATIFGDDYDTPDGTCIRDYVHVEDLVDAHVTAMNALESGDQRFYNLGIGRGYSVREIVDSVKRVTGINFTVKKGQRRPGDPPQLYANASKIQNQLNWRAKYTKIDDIVATAWAWFKDHPDGYGDKK